jgi:hypothetical protein
MLEVSECASTLGSGVRYELIDAGDDHTIKTGTLSCGHTVQDRGVPAGDYKLVVTSNGKKGTYKLKLEASPKETFALTLPFTVSGGVPSAGAGNLETGGSEDVYTFTTTAAGNLQIDISDCDGSLASWVHYNLINTATSDSVSQGWSCWSQMVSSLPAGDYRLVIDNGRRTGTYELDVSHQP